MLAVETLDLAKDYYVGFWRKRPRKALQALNLCVESGEIFGLLGPNGAGKTTTLKLLFRLVFPTSGTARILGKDIKDVSVHARVGYLPENPYFYDHLTAEEYLNFAAELFGIPAPARRRRVGDLLEQVGLTEARDVPLRRFSKGMVQRVGIAQALVNDPEVIFLDEPISGLDPLGRREVRELILRLKEQKKTVFFSTHILSDAELLCDRVAILNRGRLLGCGELSKILSLGVHATEIVLENPAPETLAELSSYTSALVQTGERVRFEVPEQGDVAKVLEIALRRGARIVSLNPLKMSLEDYFLAQVAPATEKAREKQARLGVR